MAKSKRVASQASNGADSKRAKKGTKSESSSEDKELAVRCVNTVRCLSADIVEKAKSGHPGAPMGCAPIAYTLFTKVMKYSPSNPKWAGRDRFILSNGHACALLYTMLHLTGYPLSMDELKKFRKVDSQTPGHPENFLTPGVDVSTGPLGQGISNAVGMAIAEKHLAATFNTDEIDIVDNYTYVLCGDGCLQEGVSSEACSLAGHLGLGKLIVLYDDNQITIDGSTDLSFTEDVLKRYGAYNWHTQTVADVNDLGKLLSAIETAKGVKGKPSIIKVKTVIAFGSSNAGSEKTHGAPLGAEDVAHVKKEFGFDPEKSFDVPTEVAEFYTAAGQAGVEKEKEWNEKFAKYEEAHPDLAKEFKRRKVGMGGMDGAGDLPEKWEEVLPHFAVGVAAKATRQTGGAALNALADMLPELIGGSADLTPSNLTQIKGDDFQKDTPEGRYIRFGVREHGMSAIANGIFAYGGIRPFVATFLNFIGYALGAVRLSALSRFGVLYVMTHDSIGLGEDGPTHQPIETLAQLRAMPNINVFRPCDGNEVAGSYGCAMEAAHTPSVIALSRQSVPILEGTSIAAVKKGAYTLCTLGSGDGPADLIIASTGSEVFIAVDVAKKLVEDGKKVTIVSMPCWELFELQSKDYQLSVFPGGIPVMSIEAAGIFGWERYAHASFGLARFGSSGPGPDVYEKFGLTVENLTKQAHKVVSFYEKGAAPSLLKKPALDLVGYGVGH